METITTNLSTLDLANKLAENITKSGLSIFDEIPIGDATYWIPSSELEVLLNNKLVGIDLGSLPIKTRSKVVKTLICEALGYPVPKTFKKTQPRYIGQNFDVYTQKANNFQVWNEEISPSRRYVLVRPSKQNVIVKVKVVSGEMLSTLDRTGKLTQKYQARLVTGSEKTELVSSEDTALLKALVSNSNSILKTVSPTNYPNSNSLLPIETLYNKLKSIVGSSFPDAGSDQERNRGAALHKLVCEKLGYSTYKDDGRFPDVKHQLLEVKLQTSPTIDLGLFSPDSTSILDIRQIDGNRVRLCDVRYAVFYGVIEEGQVKITNFYLTTGEDFFSRFPQFQGKVLNSKLQIKLKKDFFE